MRLFKMLNASTYRLDGQHEWRLPQGEKPGEWMPPITGELELYKNGYHLLRERDLIFWLAPDLYEAEYRGEVLEHERAVVVREARLLRRVDTYNGQILRLFAADCIEHVLPDFYCLYPEHEARLYHALGIGRLLAKGLAIESEAKKMRREVQSAINEGGGVANSMLSAVIRLLLPTAEPYLVAWWASSSALLVVSTADDPSGVRKEEQWQTQRLLWYLYP